MPLRSRIGLRSLVRRIQKLEVRFLPFSKPEIPDRPLNESDLQLVDAIERLKDRMDPELRRIVEEDWSAMDVFYSHGRLDYRGSRVTTAFLHYVFAHLESHTPLELPAEVASVWVKDPEARTEHECADCGYDLPYFPAAPYRSQPREEAIYFQKCPVCGGMVGAGAFYEKHGFHKNERPGQVKWIRPELPQQFR